MKILKAIGGVFVKIWRWIKNTAWVQPLLIVGAIFGIIFSIPAITNGIQGLINGSSSADNFYKSFKKSMEGENTSEIDTLLEHYHEYTSAEQTPSVPKDELKYFLMFTTEGNATAKDMKEGFEVLKNNWNSTYAPPAKVQGKVTPEFKLYTVYTDEVTSETKKDETAFSQFIDRKSWFFEEASGIGYKSQYYINGKLTDTDLDALANPDPAAFKTPTIILVDFTDKTVTDEVGISQVMFDVPGNDNYERAKLLWQCWYAEGDFSPNPVSK